MPPVDEHGTEDDSPHMPTCVKTLRNAGGFQRTDKVRFTGFAKRVCSPQPRGALARSVGVAFLLFFPLFVL
jgi:hypothetical protein